MFDYNEFQKLKNLKVKYIQLHGIKNNKCECGIACGAEGKKSWGKWGKSENQKSFIGVIEIIKRYPCRNIGLVLTEDLLALDIDPKNGGDVTFDEFEDSFGRLPETLTIKTGSGGYHYIYRIPEYLKPIKNVVGILPGIDIKTKGGYIVSAGSRHISGGSYKVVKNTQPVLLSHIELEKLLIQRSTIKNNSNISKGTFGEEGQRNTDMFAFCSSLRGKGVGGSIIMKLALSANKNIFSPPLPISELNSIVKSVVKYQRGENKEPKLKNINFLKYNKELFSILDQVKSTTEASLAPIIMQLLCLFSSYIGHRAIYKISYSEKKTLNMFVSIVGKTSTGRKGTSFGVARTIFEKIIPDDQFFKQNTCSGLSSGEGLMMRVRDPLSEKDLGVTDKRLCIKEPEMGRFLKAGKRETSTLTAILRDAYDGNSLATMVKTDPLKATNPHISLIGHITPTEYQKELSNNDANNGLANRFLYVHSERTSLLAFGALKCDLGEDFEIIKRNIINFEESTSDEVHEFRLHDDGTEESVLWSDLYREFSSINCPYRARMTDYILKVACLLSILNAEKEISYESMKASEILCRYCFETVDHMLGTASPKMDSAKQKVLNHLEVHGEISRTEIRNLFGRNKSHEEINNIERDLIRDSKIVVQKDGRTSKWLSLKSQK